MTLALIALGSNLGDREAHLRGALSALAGMSGVGLVAVSSLYETAPVGGPSGQGAFLNASAVVRSSLGAEDLLDRLLGLEIAAGRVREGKNGPRTLDLDLLLYGDAVLELDRLRVPHKHMLSRPFVMEPAREIAPDWVHPELGRPLKDLGCGSEGILGHHPFRGTLPDHPAVGDPVTCSELPDLRRRLQHARDRGRSVGFVPTMGALHEGHLSLVQAALDACDVVVTSIFVNPLQFGPREDLGSYPRTPEEDLKLLGDAGCGLVWMPTPAVMYPAGFCTRVNMDGLTDVLCGKSRPTHFGGVLTVVLKLLNQVAPDRAFFGQKDFQQTVVVRRMAEDLDLPCRIVVCPIVREADGLAMSSRNRYLTREDREAAPAIFRTLKNMEDRWAEGHTDAHQLLEMGRADIRAESRMQLDYLEIRDPRDLTPREGCVLPGDLVAVAVRLGSARLIDNLLFGAGSAGSAPNR